MEDDKEPHHKLGFIFELSTRESYGISGKILMEYQDLSIPNGHTLFITSQPRNQSPLEFMLAYNGEELRTKKEVMIFDWSLNIQGKPPWIQIIELPNVEWEAKYVQNIFIPLLGEFKAIHFWNFYNNITDSQEIYLWNKIIQNREMIYKVNGKPILLEALNTASGWSVFEYIVKSGYTLNFNEIGRPQGVIDIMFMDENENWQSIDRSMSFIQEIAQIIPYKICFKTPNSFAVFS